MQGNTFVRPLAYAPAGLHTADHRDCPGCGSLSRAHGEVGLADMRFPEAFEEWIKSRVVGDGPELRVRYIAERSEQTYREYAKALSVFFSAHVLREIHDGHLRRYQIDRAAGNGAWKGRAGQNRIHKEVALMLRLLRNSGVWKAEDLREAFDQLPYLDTDVRRAMEPDEQTRLLDVLRSRKSWRWIYSYTVVALQTCASTNELRSIRLRDVNFDHATVRITLEGSKDKYRNRTIPLESREVVDAFAYLVARSRELGATSDSHYLLPFGGGSRKGGVDPSQPISRFGLARQWPVIRKKAGLPWLRPYDLRHSAITRMAEAGTPMAVMRSFAGHVSPKMEQHYTTISMQAKRGAAAAVWGGPAAFMPPGKKPSGSVGASGEWRYGT